MRILCNAFEHKGYYFTHDTYFNYIRDTYLNYILCTLGLLHTIEYKETKVLLQYLIKLTKSKLNRLFEHIFRLSCVTKFQNNVLKFVVMDG